METEKRHDLLPSSQPEDDTDSVNSLSSSGLSLYGSAYSSDEISDTGHNIQNELPSAVKDLIKKCRLDSQSLKRAKATVYIDLLDYGGHKVFYATHYSFLNKEAIYFAVFDASKPLHCVEESTFKFSETEVFVRGSNETNYDRLEEWISAICLMRGPEQRKLIKHDRMNYEEPLIFLVGTHRDQIKGTPEEVELFLEQQNEYLEKRFKGKGFLPHIIPATDTRYFYAVDNTLSDPGKGKEDEEVVALKKKTQEISDILKTTYKVPFLWLKFEQKIRKMKENDSTKKMMSIEEFWIEAKEAGFVDDATFMILIRFLSNRLVLLYCPLAGDPETEGNVVLDVQWLASVFQEVITVHSSKRSLPKYRNNIDRAPDKGIVAVSYLHHLLSEFSKYREAIIKTLIYFDLVCPYKAFDPMSLDQSDDKKDFVSLGEEETELTLEKKSLDFAPRVYFVPCLLTQAFSSVFFDRRLQQKGALPLLLYSDKYRFPETLFFRLLTRLSHRFPRMPVLHCNVGIFIVHQTQSLVVALSRYSLQFTVVPFNSLEIKMDVCSRVRELIVRSVNILKQQGMAGLRLQLGFNSRLSELVELCDDSLTEAQFVSLEGYPQKRKTLYVNEGEILSERALKMVKVWYKTHTHVKSDTLFGQRAEKQEEGEQFCVNVSRGDNVASDGSTVEDRSSTTVIGHQWNFIIQGSSVDEPKLQLSSTDLTGACGTSDVSPPASAKESLRKSSDCQRVDWSTPLSSLLVSPVHVCVKTLCKCLDENDPAGDDWRALAKQLKIRVANVDDFETWSKGPTEAVLTTWMHQQPCTSNLGELIHALSEIMRNDAAMILLDHVNI
eukprot:m.267433 g.267433  ORF g.267433 m.267433 type:complete len:835 (+) comp40513_c0_seq8:477-2981(+)